MTLYSKLMKINCQGRGGDEVHTKSQLITRAFVDPFVLVSTVILSWELW